MPRKINSEKDSSKQKVDLSKIKNILPRIKRVIALNILSSFLSVIFYIIWILIGLFILWFIYANFRLGAFDQLFGRPGPASSQAASQSQPTETTIPGIGRVNIDCVQSSLSQDAIMKIVNEKSDKSLSADDKSKLAKCIVSPDQSTPSASPSQ